MLKKILILVSVSTASALLASKINLPLPFFLGPVFGVMILAFNGFKFEFPTYFWDLTRIVVGTYFGTKLNEQILSNLIFWSGSFILQIILIIISIIVLSFYFKKFCGYDLPTSVSSSTPGGATTVFLISQDMGNINIPKHFITHLTRIFIVLTVLPFIARHFIDYDEAINLTIQNFDVIEILKIFFFSIIAAYAAKFLKIPAPFFLGPVISTSIIYINGISIYQFPDLGLNICLIIIGANIGLRFQNYKVKDFISNLKYIFFSIIILFVVTILFCYVSHLLFGHDFLALFLSYAPGGIYEMTGIAIAFNYKVDFVVTHHIVRLFTIILITPIMMKLIFNLEKNKKL